jgi:hypothetical protein
MIVKNRMKASARYRLIAALGLVLAAVLLTACGHHEPQQQAGTPESTPPATSDATPATSASTTPETSTSTQASNTPCPNPPPCKAGPDCSNYPFQPTDCWTTPYGPARADVIIGGPVAGAVRSTNMLYCDGNTYALCFFSGPPTATGSNKNALPCELKGDVADCTCQAYTSKPNFVDINGILNRGAYFETVDLCGQDGSRCKNIVNCGPRGDLPGCKAHPQAPACKYVKDQSPSNPQGSLMPKADLISTFSFAMSGKDGTNPLGMTPCSGANAGLYAGCMTAPCFYGPGHKSPTTDGELVQCQCPTYSGDYQIGQKVPSCSITGSGGTSYVWSASNTVKPTDGK